MFIFKI